MVDKQQLVFSSDDESNRTDYSFISSDQEQNSQKKDFKTSIYRMQDQINLFLQQNPGIEINFNDQKKDEVNSQFGVQDSSEQTSKYWESFSKKVLKTSLQNPNSFPSMDITIHHLNNFRQNLPQKDPLDFLKLNLDDKDKAANKKKGISKKKSHQEQQNVEDSDQNITYFSYKKKQQEQAKQINIKDQVDQKVKNKRSKSNNSDNSDHYDNQDTMKINFEKQFKANMAFDEQQSKNSKDQEKFKQQKYQSYAGQILYQLYSQSDGDINIFRRMATSFLTGYNQKVQDEIKQIRQVSLQQKHFFTTEKELNFLIPNFDMAAGSNEIQEDIESIKLSPNTPEGELEYMIDKLSNPKFLQFWNIYNNG